MTLTPSLGIDYLEKRLETGNRIYFVVLGIYEFYLNKEQH